MGITVKAVYRKLTDLEFEMVLHKKRLKAIEDRLIDIRALLTSQ